MRYKIILTTILFIFSFLYLKNSVYVIRENDSLMKTLKEKQNVYNKEPIDAIITNHTMIPGISGRKINLTKSYNKMKSINSFKESLLVFDYVKPNKSINNIHDKVILSGNPNINKISLLTNEDNRYCYTTNLDINKDCLKNNKYTIHIEKITNNHLMKVKELVKNGVIFYLDFSENNDESSLIMKYLKNNNYEIVTIDELIKE